jgi:HEAT repeat protein
MISQHVASKSRILILCLFSLLFAVPGCSRFTGKHTDQVPGVLSPRDRLRFLRDRALNAGNASETEREMIAADTAAEYRRQEDPFMRRASLTTLRAYPGEHFEAVLRESLADPSPIVRIESCRLWGARADEEALQRLRNVFELDENTEVRQEAVRALGLTGRSDAIDALTPAIDSRDPAMQLLAVESLRQCTESDFGNDVALWRSFVRGELPEDAAETRTARNDWSIF